MLGTIAADMQRNPLDWATTEQIEQGVKFVAGKIDGLAVSLETSRPDGDTVLSPLRRRSAPANFAAAGSAGRPGKLVPTIVGLIAQIAAVEELAAVKQALAEREAALAPRSKKRK